VSSLCPSSKSVDFDLIKRAHKRPRDFSRAAKLAIGIATGQTEGRESSSGNKTMKEIALYLPRSHERRKMFVAAAVTERYGNQN